MSFLVPAALGLAALAGPLVVLYMLRSRRRRVEVSSTLLWDQLPESVTSAVPWTRLRLTPLLIIQLLVLTLFVLALARPFSAEVSLLGPHTVLVVDTSGSMAMAGRFDQAKRRAIDLAADASPENLVSVVVAGPRPRVAAAFVQTPDAVRTAVEEISLTGGRADLSAAIRLARGLATPDRPANLLLLSDGGSERLPEEPVDRATHLMFDRTVPNVAVVAFGAEPAPDGTARVLVTVANHGNEAVQTSLDLAVNGLPAATLNMTIGPRAESSRTLPIEAGPGDVVMVERIGPEDGIAFDDRSWLAFGEGVERGVSVVGEGSPFLEALLDVAPGFEAKEPDESVVLIVDGGPLPDIDRPTMLIRPSAAADGIAVTGVARNLVATHQRPGEPILDSVDLAELAVAEADIVEAPSWLTLVRAGDVPLVLLGEVNGFRVVLLTFDLVHSNLPVQVGFPILGSRLLEWLAGRGAGALSAGLAGDPIALGPPAGARVVVSTPDGEHTLGEDAAAYEATGVPGVYTVAYHLADGTVQQGPVAVRVFAADESEATPRRVEVAAEPASGADETSLVREWGPWTAAVALILLGLEWWVGHQRPRVIP